jgi:hypothetical protein
MLQGVTRGPITLPSREICRVVYPVTVNTTGLVLHGYPGCAGGFERCKAAKLQKPTGSVADFVNRMVGCNVEGLSCLLANSH